MLLLLLILLLLFPLSYSRVPTALATNVDIFLTLFATAVDDQECADTGAPIMVPVGQETLGRIMNVIGEPVDERGPINSAHHVRFMTDVTAVCSASVLICLTSRLYGTVHVWYLCRVCICAVCGMAFLICADLCFVLRTATGAYPQLRAYLRGARQEPGDPCHRNQGNPPLFFLMGLGLLFLSILRLFLFCVVIVVLVLKLLPLLPGVLRLTYRTAS